MQRLPVGEPDRDPVGPELLGASAIIDPTPTSPERRECDDRGPREVAARSAGRHVFRHYQRAVYCLAWRMLGGRANPALVEDLTQETFLRVFKSLTPAAEIELDQELSQRDRDHRRALATTVRVGVGRLPEYHLRRDQHPATCHRSRPPR